MGRRASAERVLAVVCSSFGPAEGEGSRTCGEGRALRGGFIYPRFCMDEKSERGEDCGVGADVRGSGCRCAIMRRASGSEASWERGSWSSIALPFQAA